MASVLKVDKLDPQSGTALEIGTSGDTVTVPSGVGLTLTDSTLSLPTTINTDKIDPKSGTALEIGSSGDTITIPSGATITNSGTATGFGGGKVLQVVQDLQTGESDYAFRSFADTGLVVTITPAASTSKILVLVDLNSIGTHSSMIDASIQIMRSISGGADTAVYVISHSSMKRSNYVSVTGNTFGQVEKGIYLDSPSTTSAVTYSVQVMTNTDAGYWRLNNNAGINDVSSSITAMEIGA